MKTSQIVTFVVALLATASGGLVHAAPSYSFVTLAGKPGTVGTADGTGASALFDGPRGIAVDAAGNVFVADARTYTIRKINPQGVVTTIAGTPRVSGTRDGQALAAEFAAPEGLAIDRTGNLFVADGTATYTPLPDGGGETDRYPYVVGGTIRMITPEGKVTTFAGRAGEVGIVDGPGNASRFSEPGGLAFDGMGFLYAADLYSVRKISPAAEVTTFFSAPGLSIYKPAVDPAGNVYVVKYGSILKIEPSGLVTTLAGQSGIQGFVDGDGEHARFMWPTGLVCDQTGTLFVFDSSTIRTISPSGSVRTIAGQIDQGGNVDDIGGAARFGRGCQLAFDMSGNIYVADAENHTIRKGIKVDAVSPPVFVVQPYSQSMNVGANSTVTLSGATSDTSGAIYRWYRKGVLVAGATSAALTIEKVTAANEGDYSVTAENSGGAQTLNVGALTVYTPPVAGFTLRHATSGGNFLWGIAAGSARIVSVGTGGTILLSTDGQTWSKQPSGTTQWLTAVTYGAGQFVAVGDHGIVLISPDGSRWTQATAAGTAQRLNNVAYGAGMFVAVGEAGTIITSTDAQTWTPRNSTLNGWLRGVAYNSHAGSFAACGQGGSVVVSSDAVTWTQEQVYNRKTNLNDNSTDLEALVSLTNYTDFAAIGQNGTAVSGGLWPYPKGGSHWLWSLDDTGVNVRLRGLATGANAVFATGEQGVVLAGPSDTGPWSVVPSGTNANLVGGVFVGNRLYVVGENETILQSTPLYTSRLIDISSRGFVGADANVLISGFVVQGNSAKQILLRAAGPELSKSFGLSGTIATPVLTLYSANGTVIRKNAGWSTADNAAAISVASTQVGAFPFSTAGSDSALLVTLNPGAYTTQVSGQHGETGLSLVEVYDTDVSAEQISRLINISTRGYVGSGDNILIAGFVLGGDSARRVLIRAAGPALAARFGIGGVLTEPKITLYDRSGHVIQTAGAWSTQPITNEIRDASERAGAFAFIEGSNDAAMIETILPGAYTVQITGNNKSTGIALVEIYDLP